jgi:hypothetical protein
LPDLADFGAVVVDLLDLGLDLITTTLDETSSVAIALEATVTLVFLFDDMIRDQYNGYDVV